jgi:predicted NAD/FAD-binding protein
MAKPLGQFVARQGYGNAFVDDHLVPMGAAIWSATSNAMMDFPGAGIYAVYGKS